MKSNWSGGTVAPRGACGAGGVREAEDARAHEASPGLVLGHDARDARLVGWIITVVAMFALVTLAGCGPPRHFSP